MNLRNVTIWTTGVMLIGTIIVPFIYLLAHRPPALAGLIILEFVINSFACISFVWLLSGSPALVSFIIAGKLKYAVPSFILLISTIACGCLFVYTYYEALSMERPYILWPMKAILLSFPFMLPAWITALLLNRYYATKTPDPETAASTPSPPALFDGGEQTQ